MKLTKDRSVVSNLPIVPNPKKYGGIPAVYLYEVEALMSTPDETKKDGSNNPSMFAGIERPYLAFRYKEMGNEKGEERDRIYIHRYFPIDNVSNTGEELSEDTQTKAFMGQFDHIKHVFDELNHSSLAINKRALKDITVKEADMFTDDVKVRVAAYVKYYENLAAQFNGTDGKTKLYKAKTGFVPMWLKLTLNKSGKQFEMPRYINKGIIEAIRYKGKDMVQPQIYIDPVYDTIERDATAAKPVAPSDVAKKIEEDLDLD